MREIEWERVALLALAAGLPSLAAKHYGPGDHPGGSPQSVHGRKRDRMEPAQEMGGEAEAKRLQVLAIQQGYEQEMARLIIELGNVEKHLQAEEQGEWMAKAAGIKNKMLELDRRREDDMLAALVSDQPLPVVVEQLSRFNDSRQQAIDEGVALFRNLVGAGVLPASAQPVADFKASRKFRSEFMDGTILVGVKADRLAVAHEMGHWLEAVSPLIHKQCVKFYEERTAGWAPKSVRALTKDRRYKTDEKTRVDRFLDPYMGKDYVDSQGRRVATEILSMGLQVLIERPHELAEQDPEYFRLVYDLLRGR